MQPNKKDTTPETPPKETTPKTETPKSEDVKKPDETSHRQHTVVRGDTLSQIVLDYQKSHNRASQYSPGGKFNYNLLRADIQKVVDANEQVKGADAQGNRIQPGWVIDLSSLDA